VAVFAALLRWDVVQVVGGLVHVFGITFVLFQRQGDLMPEPLWVPVMAIVIKLRHEAVLAGCGLALSSPLCAGTATRPRPSCSLLLELAIKTEYFST
jgi:hypothetical protein